MKLLKNFLPIIDKHAIKFLLLMSTLFWKWLHLIELKYIFNIFLSYFLKNLSNLFQIFFNRKMSAKNWHLLIKYLLLYKYLKFHTKKNKKTINSIVIVPVIWKLPTFEWLTRKEEANNKEAGATESKTFYCVSQIFYITSFNYNATLHTANNGYHQSTYNVEKNLLNLSSHDIFQIRCSLLIKCIDSGL